MFSALRFSALKSRSLPLKQTRKCISRRYIHTEEAGPRAGYKARRDSWYNPTILILGFIPIFTFALGTWQLQRLQWKVNIIDELREKLEREPIALPRQVKCDSSFSPLLHFLKMHLQPICRPRFYLPQGGSQREMGS